MQKAQVTCVHLGLGSGGRAAFITSPGTPMKWAAYAREANDYQHSYQQQCSAAALLRA